MRLDGTVRMGNAELTCNFLCGNPSFHHVTQRSRNSQQLSIKKKSNLAASTS